MLDWLKDTVSGLAGLPFRAANIPFSVFREAAAKVDPDDDAAIRSMAEAMAAPLGVAADVIEEGIRKALGE